MSAQKIAVVIGATGSLGSSVCQALENQGYLIDETWTSKDRPDARFEASYSNLPKRIDAAIYLAGINHISNAENLSEEDWDKVIDINLKGAFLFFKAAFPGMKAAGRSTAIAISSIMASHPYPGRLAYSASKAGLEGLVRALAIEWGMHGIATHALRLGHLSGLMKSTPTNPKLLDAVRALTPGRNLISPDDVGNYIMWAINGGAHNITGSTIDFDPGYTLNRWPIN